MGGAFLAEGKAGKRWGRVARLGVRVRAQAFHMSEDGEER